jgi:hypothetical protein
MKEENEAELTMAEVTLPDYPSKVQANEILQGCVRGRVGQD